MTIMNIGLMIDNRFNSCPVQKIVPKVHNAPRAAGIIAIMVNFRLFRIKKKTINISKMAQGGKKIIILINSLLSLIL